MRIADTPPETLACRDLLDRPFLELALISHFIVAERKNDPLPPPSVEDYGARE